MNKAATIILVVITNYFVFGQSLDQKTINILRAKFEMAKESYENKEYDKTMEKLDEIDVLTKGETIPNALNLRIKTQVAQKRYSEARKNLDKLYQMQLSKSILSDIGSYEDIINNGIEEERMRIETQRKKRIADSIAEVDRIRYEAQLEKDSKDATDAILTKLFLEEFDKRWRELHGNSKEGYLLWQSKKDYSWILLDHNKNIIDNYANAISLKPDQYSIFLPYKGARYSYYDSGNYYTLSDLSAQTEKTKFLFRIKKSGKENEGIINLKTGKMIIPFNNNFEYILNFSNGLAFVKGLNGKWGIINEDGDMVTPCKLDYYKVSPFNRWGLAAVARTVNVKGYYEPVLKWGFINKEGKEIIPVSFFHYNSYADLMGENYFPRFSDGLVRLYKQVKEYGSYDPVPASYYDFTGKLILDGFYCASDFYLGRASVLKRPKNCYKKKEWNKRISIDVKGNVIK